MDFGLVMTANVFEKLGIDLKVLPVLGEFLILDLIGFIQ